MGRPRACRIVKETPTITYFKPRGVPLRDLEEASLTVEGLEAIRLADLEGLTSTQAASQMHISRHTFGRVLAEARKAVAEALIHGRALAIEGGVYAVRDQEGELPQCGQCGAKLNFEDAESTLSCHQCKGRGQQQN